MRTLLILLSALFFSTGDYLCSLGGEQRRFFLTLLGSIVGGGGYLVFAYISRVVPLSSLAGYVNGVVVIMGVILGVFLKKDVLNFSEFFFLSIILVGLLGLAYVQSQGV